MPRYDFECKACGHVWEGICSIDEREQQQCSVCKHPECQVIHLSCEQGSLSFPEGLWDIGFNEVEITSRRGLREAMNRHNDQPDEFRHSIAKYDDGYAGF